MSRENIGLEGYEPGEGYQTTIGISMREFLWTVLVTGALYMAAKVLGRLDTRALVAFIIAEFGAVFLAVGTRKILNPERWKQGETVKGARRVRIVGTVIVVISCTVTTLCLRSLVFLWQGW